MTNFTNFVILLGLVAGHATLSAFPSIAQPIAMEQPTTKRLPVVNGPVCEPEGYWDCVGRIEYATATEEMSFRVADDSDTITLPTHTHIYDGSDVQYVHIACEWIP